MGGWFHASVKTVNRASGRSATAAAAYRGGELIRDERTGETHDYRRRGGVLDKFIIAPADAPEWANDRARLWNAAEAAEKRQASRVARELELSLPADLSPAERESIARQVAAELVKRHGVAVDVALHAPHRDGDQRNFHAHMLFSTRRIGAEGFGQKTRILDNAATSGPEVEHIRSHAAAVINRHLERAGRAERVDHRSFEKRGIDKEPTQHLGPAASGKERRGEDSRIGDFNRTAAARNDHRAELAQQARVIDLAAEREKRRIAEAVQRRERKDLAQGEDRRRTAILKAQDQEFRVMASNDDRAAFARFKETQKKIDDAARKASKAMPARHRRESLDMLAVYKERDAKAAAARGEEERRQKEEARDRHAEKRAETKTRQAADWGEFTQRQEGFVPYLKSIVMGLKQSLATKLSTIGHEIRGGHLTAYGRAIWEAGALKSAIGLRHERERKRELDGHRAELGRIATATATRGAAETAQSRKLHLADREALTQRQAAEKLADRQAFEKRQLERKDAATTFAASRERARETERSFTRAANADAPPDKKAAAQGGSARTGTDDRGGGAAAIRQQAPPRPPQAKPDGARIEFARRAVEKPAAAPVEAKEPRKSDPAPSPPPPPAPAKEERPWQRAAADSSARAPERPAWMTAAPAREERHWQQPAASQASPVAKAPEPPAWMRAAEPQAKATPSPVPEWKPPPPAAAPVVEWKPSPPPPQQQQAAEPQPTPQPQPSPAPPPPPQRTR